jgi:hypothetical protein
MGFNITRKSVGGEKLSWLDSRHAVSNAQTGTLDASAFDGDLVESGILLSIVDGKYVPFSDAAGFAGLNLYTRDISTGDEPCAVLDHGRVYADALPGSPSIPADTGLVQFV